MHFKKPMHKLVLIVLASFFVLDACMVNSSNNKDDQGQQGKDTDVYVQMSIRSKKKKGFYRWDTVLKAKGFNGSDLAVPMPLSVRSSDSGGGSSPDTVDFKISVGSKYRPVKRDKDDD